MNHNNALFMLAVKITTLEEIAKNLENQYCDIDLIEPKNMAIGMTEATYISLGNTIKKIKEMRERIESRFDDIYSKFYVEKAMDKQTKKNLIDGISTSIFNKYFSMDNILVRINEIFGDYSSITTQLAKVASHYGVNIITCKSHFNPVSQEHLMFL